MGRGYSKNTYIRRILDEDAKLPIGDPNKLTFVQRIKLIEQLPKPRKGNNLPALRKKPKRTARSISPEAEARIRAIGAKPEPPPPGPSPIDAFMEAMRKEKRCTQRLKISRYRTSGLLVFAMAHSNRIHVDKFRGV